MVKNRIIYLVYTFVDALAQMFASLTVHNPTKHMSFATKLIGQNFAILGQNSQILCKNREKLGIIFSIYIC